MLGVFIYCTSQKIQKADFLYWVSLSGCCPSSHWFGLHTVGQHIQATGNQKTRDSGLPLPDASVDLPEPQTFLL